MDPWPSGPHVQGDLASYEKRTDHPSNGNGKPYDEMLVEPSNGLTDIRPPFVGFYEIVKLEVFERITLSDTSFRPLVDVDKGRVRVDP